MLEENACEQIEQSIINIDRSIKKLLGSNLKKEAVIVLIQHYSKVSKRDIEKVISTLDDLKKICLKPAKTINK